MRRLSFLLLTFLLSPGCTTVSDSSVSVFQSFQEVDMGREFSSSTISQRPFMLHVVNIEGRSSSREPMTSDQAVELLKEEFLRERSDLAIYQPQWNAADRKNLKSILDQFAGRQELPAAGYELLKKPANQNTWFLIADVEAVNDTHNISEDDIKDSKGRKIETNYRYISTRNVQVRYFIYDPAAGHLVFSGLMRSSTEATRETAGRSYDVDYPDFPGLGKALAENFQKFLRALPASKG